MGMEKNCQDWAADAQKLYEVAQELLPQMTLIEVRITRNIADEAVAAWRREEDPGELTNETDEQRSLRDDAATLALIGMAVEESGIEDGDHVRFKLDAWTLGTALNAADRAGRLTV
jgi:hypothetical protein